MKLFSPCLATQKLIRYLIWIVLSSRNKDHDKANKRDQALIFAFIAFKLNQISVLAFRFVQNLSKQRNYLSAVQNFAKHKIWFKSKNANLWLLLTHSKVWHAVKTWAWLLKRGRLLTWESSEGRFKRKRKFLEIINFQISFGRSKENVRLGSCVAYCCKYMYHQMLPLHRNVSVIFLM